MWGGAAGAGAGVSPCCPSVGALRLRRKGRAPSPLPRCWKEGGRGRGPGSWDPLEGRTGVPNLPAKAWPRSLQPGARGYNGLRAECGRQGGDAGGQGAAVRWTLELERRQAEGGVPTSGPVPLHGKGAGRPGGDGRRKRQRNGGAFNQHPLVLPTRPRRPRRTGRGGGIRAGRIVRKCYYSC